MYENSAELAENKLLVLYVIKSLRQPISKTQLTEIILENNFINYFTLQQYISELETIGKSVKNDFDNIKIKMHNSILDLLHYVSDHSSYLLLNSFYIKYCR